MGTAITQEQAKHLQLQIDKVVDIGRRMRGAQREYRKYHASADKARAQALERQFDALVDIIVKEQKSKQQEIF